MVEQISIKKEIEILLQRSKYHEGLLKVFEKNYNFDTKNNKSGQYILMNNNKLFMYSIGDRGSKSSEVEYSKLELLNKVVWEVSSLLSIEITPKNHDFRIRMLNRTLQILQSIGVDYYYYGLSKIRALENIDMQKLIKCVTENSD